MRIGGHFSVTGKVTGKVTGTRSPGILPRCHAAAKARISGAIASNLHPGMMAKTSDYKVGQFFRFI